MLSFLKGVSSDARAEDVGDSSSWAASNDATWASNKAPSDQEVRKLKFQELQFGPKASLIYKRPQNVF